MNVPAYAIIDTPKHIPHGHGVRPSTATAPPEYHEACRSLLYACFNSLPADIIKARAERMREIRGKL